jgi:serine phosphatase RsbU (regulator of sigma subunit)
MPHSPTIEPDDSDEIRWRCRAQAAENELGLIRAMLDLLPDYFYIHNWDLEFQYVNKSGAALWNLRPEEVIGKSYASVDPNAQQAQRVIEVCRALMRQGGTQRVDGFAFQDPCGAERVLSQFNVAFKHPVSGQDMLLGVARDMTAEVRLDAELTARRAMEQQMLMARTIQLALEPSHTPKCPGFSIAGRNTPSAYASGDFYDWWVPPLATPSNAPSVMLCLGDVTGHGVGPALNASACRAYARCLLRGGTSMEADLASLNRTMCSEMQAGRFVTLASVQLDGVAGEVAFMSAGHGPTLHCHADGTSAKLESCGLPLGIDPDEQYEPPKRIRLRPGESFVLMSDGLVEARCPAGKMLSANALAEEVFRLSRLDHQASSIAQGLIDFTMRHTGLAHPDDDLTVVVICAAK